MKKSKLRFTSVYLCGAMEAAANLGAGWREDITPFVIDELGHKVLDPCKLEDEKLKGFRINRLPDGYVHWHQMKNSNNPAHIARFSRYMKQIIKFDVDIIEKESGYLITLWDRNAAKGAGTHAEMTIAFLNGLPIYCVNTFMADLPLWRRMLYTLAEKLGIKVRRPRTMPAWLRACCTEVFDSFEDLKVFLLREFGGVK